MKTKRTSIFKAIVVVILLASASVTKAQNYDTQVQPYPAKAEGQTLLIDQSNEFWDEIMEQATISILTTQAELDSNPGVLPTAKLNCGAGVRVCCQTDAIYCPDHGVWHFITQCEVDGVPRDLIQQ